MYSVWWVVYSKSKSKRRRKIFNEIYWIKRREKMISRPSRARRQEPVRSPAGVRQESVRSPSGVRQRPDLPTGSKDGQTRTGTDKHKKEKRRRPNARQGSVK